jgi:hypothetical protein
MGEPGINDLTEAFGAIRDICRHVAHFTESRGYSPVTLAITPAASGPAIWLAQPSDQIPANPGIWISTVLLSASLIRRHTFTQARRIHSGIAGG